MRAAIIYQHASAEADARIAAALEAELSGDHEDQADDEAGPDEDEDGGAGALVSRRLRASTVARVWPAARSGRP